MERLTHSKRSSFLFCQRQFYWRYEQGLELVIQRPGRRRGTIFGDALCAARDQAQELGQTEEGRSILEAGDESMHSPHAVAMLSIDLAYAEFDDTVNSQDDADSLEVERAKVRVMVDAYMKRYGLSARREVEYELPFRNPATGGYSKTFRIAGKIDGLQSLGQQRARIVEDKFVGQIQKAMIDRLPLDSQITEYVDALRSRGWSAEVSYRHTRYPGINPTKEKKLKTKAHPAETLDEFEVRLAEDVQARPDHYFDEQVLVFPVEHLDDFQAERWEVGQQIIAARAHARAGLGELGFPKNPTRCWEYGGCPYIPLCARWPGAMDRYQQIDGEIELSAKEAE